MSREIECYTSNMPANAARMDYKGIVMTNKTMSKNFVADCGTACRSCIGGEVKNLTKMTKEMREDLMVELVEKAHGLGANAIIAINMETSTVFDGTLDIVAYGTAVYVHKD